MVVIPKSNSKVRVCVDQSKLNEYVKRENHPLPAVDTTLRRLTDSRVLRASMGIKTTDNIHYSMGPFLLQCVALWDQF